MNFEQYTQKAIEAVNQSQQIALEFSHQAVEPGHLLLALLRQSDGLVPAILTRVAGSDAGLTADVEKSLQAQPKIPPKPTASTILRSKAGSPGTCRRGSRVGKLQVKCWIAMCRH